MIQKLSLLSLVVAFVVVSSKSQWVSLTEGSTPTTPRVTLLHEDQTQAVLKVELSGFEVSRFVANEQSYQAVNLLTEIVTNQAGSPEVPYVAEMLIVPDRGSVTAEVVEFGEIRSYDGYNLPPAKPTWAEGDPEPDYAENATAYSSSTSFPKELVKLDEPIVFRDFRAVRVSVYPITYIPAKKELHVASSVTIRLNYGPGPTINPRNGRKHVRGLDQHLVTLVGRQRSRHPIEAIANADIGTTMSKNGITS